MIRAPANSFRPARRAGARQTRAAGLLGLVATGLVVHFAGAQARAPEHAPEHAQADLAYRVAPNASGCPSRADLVDAVASRLGYDPFVPSAKLHVEVDVTFARGTYTGKLVVGGSRSLTSTSCRELVDSLAVAVALGLDPDSALRPPATTVPPQATAAPSSTVASPEPSAPASATVPALEPPTPPTSPSAGTHEMTTRLWVGPLGALGDTPSATVGLGLGAELGLLRRLALEGELSATLPSSVRIGRGGRGTTSASVSQLLLGACIPVEPASFCATGSGGFLYADASDVDVPRQAFALYAAVGLRASLRLAISPRLFLRFQVDGQVPLARTELVIDGASLWETSPVVGRLGLGVGLRL